MLAIVVDPVQQNADVVKHLGLSYRVLSDTDMRVIDSYDLRHKEGGPYGDVARSATFVLDKDGIVRWRDLTDNFRLRPHPEDVVAQVARLGM